MAPYTISSNDLQHIKCQLHTTYLTPLLHKHAHSQPITIEDLELSYDTVLQTHQRLSESNDVMPLKAALSSIQELHRKQLLAYELAAEKGYRTLLMEFTYPVIRKGETRDEFVERCVATMETQMDTSAVQWRVSNDLTVEVLWNPLRIQASRNYGEMLKKRLEVLKMEKEQRDAVGGPSSIDIAFDITANKNMDKKVTSPLNASASSFLPDGNISMSSLFSTASAGGDGNSIPAISPFTCPVVQTSQSKSGSTSLAKCVHENDVTFVNDTEKILQDIAPGVPMDRTLVTTAQSDTIGDTNELMKTIKTEPTEPYKYLNGSSEQDTHTSKDGEHVDEDSDSEVAEEGREVEIELLMEEEEEEVEDDEEEEYEDDNEHDEEGEINERELDAREEEETEDKEMEEEEAEDKEVKIIQKTCQPTQLQKNQSLVEHQQGSDGGSTGRKTRLDKMKNPEGMTRGGNKRKVRSIVGGGGRGRGNKSLKLEGNVGGGTITTAGRGKRGRAKRTSLARSGK